jgi:hypothetical protein
LALERFGQMILEGVDKKCLFVRMEDLVKQPCLEMGLIYRYLGLQSYEHDFDNVEQTTIEDDVVYGLSPALHKIRSKVESVPPDYNEILGQDLCRWIDNRFRWYQDFFRYL